MGSVGDMIVSKHAPNDAAISEYFAISEKDFSTLSYYDSQVYAWLRPGTYPAWVDNKGNAEDGVLIGGSQGDAKDIAFF